jgi:hypothetical protein
MNAQSARQGLSFRPDIGALHRNNITTLNRAVASAALSAITHEGPERIAARVWPDDVALVPLLKGSTAITTTASAAALVQQIIPSFIASLTPVSAAAALLDKSLALRFGPEAGLIHVPRISPPAATFVGEGKPIPLAAGLITGPILEPKKIAVIMSTTREVVTGSPLNVEAVLGAVLRESAAVALDAALFSAAAAVPDERPPGLLNGVAAIAASTATPAGDAMAEDLATLAGSILRVGGPLIYVAAPEQAIAVALRAPSFAYPILASSALPAGTVIAVAGNALAAAVEAVPRISSTFEATFHEETVPLGGVVGAPTRALFQTDTLALRMILPCDWALRTSGGVAWISGATW